MTKQTIFFTKLQPLALVLSLCLCTAGRADTLYFRDGDQLAGSLKEITKKKVVFETDSGIEKHKKAEVLKVQLQRKRKYDHIEKVEDITDPKLKASLASQPTQADFPAAGYVTLLVRQTYDLREPGIVRDTTRRIVKVLQQRGEDVASQNVY